MNQHYEGNAVIFCEGAFGTTNGKTAHGLVRRSERYRVLAVIDSRHAGKDAGEVLDGTPNGIPLVSGLEDVFAVARNVGHPVTHFVVGLSPDGGRLEPQHRQILLEAIRAGLNVDSGMHDLLSHDSDLVESAIYNKVRLRDIRKAAPREHLHFFTGKIDEVGSLRIAVLGTDSAVGKRTTAWLIVDALRSSGRTCELIGTGQTAWLQGARYSIVLDSIINDFVSGEIEHAIWRAWDEQHPDVLVLEGQGSLLNPAYPGGFELLAAGRPHVVVLQHAPARIDYDGFPGQRMHPLTHQIQAIELISGKPVVAITLNHEGLTEESVMESCRRIHEDTGLPVCDPLTQGVDAVMQALAPHLRARMGAA